MASLDGATFINFALSFLLKRIVVPSDYESQVKVVKEMQMDDLTGLVDSLTDFQVQSATVDFSIETDNDQFTKILKKWLNEINKDYPQIPSGIIELAKEYFKIRWKYSSFPILKIAEWDEMDGITVPTKMFFVDGQSIVAREIDEKNKDLKVINYDYYIGSKEEHQYKLEKNCIFARPFGRWFDKYPVPYLIKRGVYHNWKLIQSLKNMQSKILEQIIPYILLIKKGTAQLANQNVKTYSNVELQNILNELKSLKKEMEKHPGDTPARATNFDEELKHLIPDLGMIMKPELFAQAERNILSGLGFIDVIQGISDTRRESILNPRGFVTEIKSGVEGFKGILKELVFLIQEKNKKHKKYMNSEFYINASSVTTFMTDNFKNQMRMLWERGQLSNKTYAEIVGEVDYRTERARRQKEAKDGDEYTMYPHLTKNVEDKGIDIVSEKPIDTDVNGDPIPTDKTDDKEKFDLSKNKTSDLVTAPYTKIADLPARIKKNMSPGLQGTFLRVFNDAFQQYHNETRAFRVAWSVIKKIARKNKKDKWVRKIKSKLTRAMLESILEKEDEKTIKEVMDELRLGIATKQSKLLDKLLNKETDKKKK